MEHKVEKLQSIDELDIMLDSAEGLVVVKWGAEWYVWCFYLFAVIFKMLQQVWSVPNDCTNIQTA